MRDFFKTELARLHLTTGMQQYFKLSPAEITELLDMMCLVCSHYPLIPDEKKQEFIREAMETDSEFLGFNKKILRKWLNTLNRGYIVTQAQYQDTQTVVPSYADYVKMCKEADIEPASEQDYDKPVKPEYFEKFLAETKASLEGQTTAEQAARNRALWLEEQRKKFGVSPEKRAEIQEERERRVWEIECFNDDATKKENWMTFELWRGLRQEATKKLQQGKSQFTEEQLTPRPVEVESQPSAEKEG